MKLIDADELILHLNDYALQEATFMHGGYGGKYDAIQECIKTVEEQPTAYDVDKVVEQLERRGVLARPVGWAKTYEIVLLKEAIEIVKVGGRDEE